MWHERLLFTRSARRRLHALPAEVRVLLETHLGNLGLLAQALPPERLPGLLARAEESFVTSVPGARVFFTMDTAARAVLVHRIERVPRPERAAPDDSAPSPG